MLPQITVLRLFKQQFMRRSRKDEEASSRGRKRSRGSRQKETSGTPPVLKSPPLCSRIASLEVVHKRPFPLEWGWLCLIPDGGGEGLRKEGECFRIDLKQVKRGCISMFECDDLSRRATVW